MEQPEDKTNPEFNKNVPPANKTRVPASSKPVVKTSEKKEKTSWREHDNKIVRFFAKTGFTIWIIVMVVGLGLAFVVAIFAV